MSDTILLTIKEAAMELRLSQGFIRAAIRRGELPVVKFGRSLRIFREQLIRWARRNEVTAKVDDVSLVIERPVSVHRNQ